MPVKIVCGFFDLRTAVHVEGSSTSSFLPIMSYLAPVSFNQRRGGSPARDVPRLDGPGVSFMFGISSATCLSVSRASQKSFGMFPTGTAHMPIASYSFSTLSSIGTAAFCGTAAPCNPNSRLTFDRARRAADLVGAPTPAAATAALPKRASSFSFCFLSFAILASACSFVIPSVAAACGGGCDLALALAFAFALGAGA